MANAADTPVERDGTLVWSGTGRALSPYELRLIERCGRLWLPLFDGVYLLALHQREVASFEQAHQRSVMGLRGAFHTAEEVAQMRADVNPPHGFEWPAWAPPPLPTREQMMELIHAALIGGGRAVVGGDAVVVTPARATELLVNRYGDAPVSTLEPIVRAILQRHCDGAAPTPEERDAFTIERSEPVPPKWALAA